MEFALQKTLYAPEVKNIRKNLNMKQKELAVLLNVSVKTVEHWESSGGSVSGAAAALLCILRERPWLPEELEIPEKKFPLRLRYLNGDRLCTIIDALRLRYLNGDRLCTIIDVNDREQRVIIKNYVTDPLYRAFGRNEHPSYRDYEEFLESRCFPRTRDKMKIILEELNLPFYDPFLIIQKTEGKMAEDDFRIEIER